ncbi:MAG: polysaccharide biosynthesis protein [Paludibacteraceae bacterium]|nr:polysaccharide biosynthesis protein [Paludibacteraceae bacterium]
MEKAKYDSWFSKLINFYFSKNAAPYWIILILDCIIVLFSGLISHMLNAGVLAVVNNFGALLVTWGAYLIAYLIGFRILRTYSGMLRFSSFVDLFRILGANLIGVVFIFVIRHITPIDSLLHPLPVGELMVALVLSTSLMWALRIIVKLVYEVFFVARNAQRVFIYGVKDGGIALAKLIRSQHSKFTIAGFVSDEKADLTHMLMGSKIYLNDESLPEEMQKKGAKLLMISPLKTEELRENTEMIDRLTNAGIRMMIYSHSVWDGKSDIHHNQLKEVDIEDLLPRNQIEVDITSITKVLTGKCICITGAAGSIGSEIVRQVASFKPSQLVLIDQAETPLHDIRLMMSRQFPDVPALTLTASIHHRIHMESIFKQYRPQYVFHAAAYKHVPMMEDNPGEAVINNIDGTRIIADLAVKYGAEKFVMVSTDKAVNPTNVMGCSKRICEMYCQSLDRAIKDGKVEGKTQFVTTRFGNVLGSNGSVIPLFKEQIKAGGPLTVTHPDIIRYFMLIPEACNLVLQAGTMGNGGEIYVFDMGKPVKIADLAKRMIVLSGATDVEIKYTGLRDGEKLYEELLNKEENTKPSSHPKIKLADVRELDYFEVREMIDELVQITKQGFEDMPIVKQMKIMVPEFKSKNSKYEALD